MKKQNGEIFGHGFWLKKMEDLLVTKTRNSGFFWIKEGPTKMKSVNAFNE